MGDFDPVFVHTLAAQSWALYSVGMFFISLRMYASIHRLGIKHLKADDYLMAFAGGLYTMLIVCLNVISGGGGSNLYPPEDFPTFTQHEVQQRIEGSKIVVASEQAMLNLIYTIKACMLFMYYTRITLTSSTQKLVFYLAIYVSIGWLATEISFFTACRPFSGYWAMPPPNPQCTTLEHYAIIQGCFNITSDALMICIPVPLIIGLKVTWKQKAPLAVLFSMGIFVILAAVLTKVYNLSDIWDPSYMLWYTREASVAVYVSNLPMIWPLLREWFPSLNAVTPRQMKISSGRTYGIGSSGRIRSATHAHGSRASRTGIVTTIQGKGDSTEVLSEDANTEMRDLEVGESWNHRELSMGQKEMGLVGSGWENSKESMEGGIMLTKTVQISEERVADPNANDAQILVTSPSKERNLEKVHWPKAGFKWDFKKMEEK